jgi:hypothetical protein
MPAITERVAKTQYGILPCGNIVGWSLKAASTLIYAHVKNKIVRRCGIHEAAEGKADGLDVVLVVRHPLDRLVSNYVFWRTVNKGAIGTIMAKDNGPADDDRPVLDFPAEGKLADMTIEEWYAFTQRKYNQHWVDQSSYHTYKGDFVPNVLLPWEVLPTLKTKVVNPSPRKGTWEDYFTPEFREQMEERYMNDLAIYVMAKESWDGKRPKYF